MLYMNPQSHIIIMHTYTASSGLLPLNIDNFERTSEPSTLGSENSSPSASNMG